MTSPLTLEPTDVALSDHVTLLAGDAKGKYPDGNSVLVAGSEGVVLIDPSLTVHRRGGGPCAVDRILVSHAHEDHMSGISAVIRGSNTNGSLSGALSDGTTIHARSLRAGATCRTGAVIPRQGGGVPSGHWALARAAHNTLKAAASAPKN